MSSVPSTAWNSCLSSAEALAEEVQVLRQQLIDLEARMHMQQSAKELPNRPHPPTTCRQEARRKRSCARGTSSASAGRSPLIFSRGCASRGVEVPAVPHGVLPADRGVPGERRRAGRPRPLPAVRASRGGPSTGRAALTSKAHFCPWPQSTGRLRAQRASHHSLLCPGSARPTLPGEAL